MRMSSTITIDKLRHIKNNFKQTDSNIHTCNQKLRLTATCTGYTLFIQLFNITRALCNSIFQGFIILFNNSLFSITRRACPCPD